MLDVESKIGMQFRKTTESSLVLSVVGMAFLLGWQRSLIPHSSIGNSPIRGWVWNYFIPHRDINIKKTFSIGFSGDGAIPLLPIPVTRWAPDNTVHSSAQPSVSSYEAGKIFSDEDFKHIKELKIREFKTVNRSPFY